MSTIIKDDILQKKSKETGGKEKVNKIMDTIVESSLHPTIVKPEKQAPSGPAKPSKIIAKQNIFSGVVLIEGENAEDLNDIKGRLINELKPSNEIESIIVDRIISNIWRLKRCLNIESQILEYETSCIQEYKQGIFSVRKRTEKELNQLKALKIAENRNKIRELINYETILEEQTFKALNELNKVRSQDSKQENKAKKTKKQSL